MFCPREALYLLVNVVSLQATFGLEEVMSWRSVVIVVKVVLVVFLTYPYDIEDIE